MGENNQNSISNRCAPAAKPASQQGQQQPNVCSLTQMGAGLAGRDGRILVCWPERLSDNQGNFQDEILHPVIGDLQTDPRITASVREVEFRAAITTDRKPGLVYRKLPYSTGAPNSWTSSAETVIKLMAESCGRARSDHNAGAYYFEPLNGATEFASSMPDVDIMIEELLGDYVIDHLDHPTLQRLLHQGQQYDKPQSGQVTTGAESAEVDDDEVY